MQVAAPLLVLGLSPAILAWCVPRSWRFVLTRSHSFTGLQALWKLLSHPLVAWTLHVLALWVWHTPGLYQAALVNENLHALEHISFLGSGLLYWWSLLYTTRGEQLGVRLLSLFTMGLQSGLLGALLTFSPQTWYTGQSAAAASWGLTPLSDQQLAGVLMWMPAGLIYLAAALWALGWQKWNAMTWLTVQRLRANHENRHIREHKDVCSCTSGRADGAQHGCLRSAA